MEGGSFTYSSDILQILSFWLPKGQVTLILIFYSFKKSAFRHGLYGISKNPSGEYPHGLLNWPGELLPEMERPMPCSQLHCEAITIAMSLTVFQGTHSAGDTRGTLGSDYR